MFLSGLSPRPMFAGIVERHLCTMRDLRSDVRRLPRVSFGDQMRATNRLYVTAQKRSFELSTTSFQHGWPRDCNAAKTRFSSNAFAFRVHEPMSLRRGSSELISPW